MSCIKIAGILLVIVTLYSVAYIIDVKVKIDITDKYTPCDRCHSEYRQKIKRMQDRIFRRRGSVR